MNGIDAEAAREERRTRKIEGKKQVVYLPGSVRLLIAVFAGIAIAMNILSVIIFVSDKNFVPAVCYFLQIILCVAILICLKKRTKKTELAVMGMCMLFLVLRIINVGLFI
jgi:uncharacterized membrane protein